MTPFGTPFHKFTGVPWQLPEFSDLIPKSGCPLEDHPDFEVMYNQTPLPSWACWDDFGQTIILQQKDDGSEGIVNIAYKPNTYVGAAALIECNYLVNPPGNTSWALPIAKMVDQDNLIGVRVNNNEIQITQRHDGTWSTLATAPAQLGRFRVLITSATITVSVDDVDALSTTHSISEPGHFGLSLHRWTLPGDTPVVSRYAIALLEETLSPCMTSATAPYGEVTAGNIINSTYPGWKGMNCSVVNSADAWCTDVGIDPADGWIMWVCPECQPMIPVEFTIKPRVGMATDWYLDNNPNGVAFYGIRADGSEVLLYEKVPLNDWGNANSRTWKITGVTEAFYGFRLHIPQTKKSAGGGDYHTCIGWLRVKGTPAQNPYPDNVVRYQDAIVTHNGEYVTHA